MSQPCRAAAFKRAAYVAKRRFLFPFAFCHRQSGEAGPRALHFRRVQRTYAAVRPTLFAYGNGYCGDSTTWMRRGKEDLWQRAHGVVSRRHLMSTSCEFSDATSEPPSESGRSTCHIFRSQPPHETPLFPVPRKNAALTAVLNTYPSGIRSAAREDYFPSSLSIPI